MGRSDADRVRDHTTAEQESGSESGPEFGSESGRESGSGGAFALPRHLLGRRGSWRAADRAGPERPARERGLAAVLRRRRGARPGHPAGTAERAGEPALAAAPRDPGWRYREPAADELPALLPSATPVALSGPDLADRLYGAWLGRCVANTMGKPVEGLTAAEVETYLRAAGAWPQQGFVPLLNELPPGVSHLHQSAAIAAQGRFTSVPRDDDLDWTLIGLHLLETYGDAVTTEDIGREWLNRLPFTQTFTAERVAYRNLVGELWAAGLVAGAFVTRHPQVALAAGRSCMPDGSRLAEVLDGVAGLADDGASYEQARAWLDEHTGQYNWVHTVNNAGVIAVALLWGGGDFITTVALSVAAGLDTDSNAATVGSVFGALHGATAIPPGLRAAGGERLSSAVQGFDGIETPVLAERSLRLAERLAAEQEKTPDEA